MSIWSYPKIHNIGGRFTENLFNNPVIVEEKIDGSQFSFCKTSEGLKAKSKGQDQRLDSPDKMFSRAIEAIKAIDLLYGLKPDWVYRGEYLQKSKHNALAYDRIPNYHIILFDIETADQSFMSYEDKTAEANRLGLEVVPRMFEGEVTNVEHFRSLMDTISCLGGQKIEGIVIKNYYQFGPDGKVLMGKHVSEAFKEVHRAAWKQSNPGPGDILDRLVEMYKTPARWEKGIQHLREKGLLTDSPQDIGKLINEVRDDIKEECTEDMKDVLFKWAIGHVLRGVTGGLPEWYKEKLVDKQFEGKDTE